MAGGRVKNSMRNIIYRLSSQIINILLKFIGRTVFIYVLGVEYLGISGLFSEILQMLSLTDLGLSSAMVFSMYEPLAKNDEKKLTQLVALYKKIYTVIALTISGLGICLLPFLKYLVNLETHIPYIHLYYLLYLANTVSSYLVIYKTSILIADQKNYLISKYNMLFNVLSTLFCSIFLWITRNFIVYLIVQVLFTYASNLYCSHVTNKMYPYINNKVDNLPKNEVSHIFENVKSVFIYKVSTTLVSSTDNTIISVLLGTIVVGYYANYSMIISNVTFFINIIFSSITASIGNMIVEKNTTKNYEVYKTMQFISFMLSVIVISCVFCLINDFIVLWIGKEYLFDLLILSSICLNMYFSVVLMPIWSYREATGMYRQTKYVMVFTAIINIVASIVLGKLIGLAGILFATSIARLCTYFWYEPKLLFKQYFNKSVLSYYKSILKNIIVLLIICISSFMLFNNFAVNSWIMLFVKAVLVGSFSLILAVLCYCRDENMIFFKRFLKR